MIILSRQVDLFQIGRYFADRQILCRQVDTLQIGRYFADRQILCRQVDTLQIGQILSRQVDTFQVGRYFKIGRYFPDQYILSRKIDTFQINGHFPDRQYVDTLGTFQIVQILPRQIDNFLQVGTFQILYRYFPDMQIYEFYSYFTIPEFQGKF